MNEEKTKDYGLFLKEMEDSILKGRWLFYFSDDPYQNRHEIWSFGMTFNPYSIKIDCQKKHSFHTAKELLEAKLFKGKSIKDRWNSVIFCSKEEKRRHFYHE